MTIELNQQTIDMIIEIKELLEKMTQNHFTEMQPTYAEVIENAVAYHLDIARSTYNKAVKVGYIK